jgi:hypothetical protein
MASPARAHIIIVKDARFHFYICAGEHCDPIAPGSVIRQVTPDQATLEGWKSTTAPMFYDPAIDHAPVLCPTCVKAYGLSDKVSLKRLDIRL